MSRIESTGSYLPKKIVLNDAFNSESVLFESINEYMDGFEERRHAEKSESSLSYAIGAAEVALERSRYSAEDIDLIIGAISPPEYLYGDDFNRVQYALGAKNAAVLPINTACSSFVSSLNTADSYIQAGKKKVVLVLIGVNWVSHCFDVEKKNYGLAGDGSAAVIVDDQGDSLIDVCEVNHSSPGVFLSMAMKNPVLTGKKEVFQITEPDGVSTAKDLILGPIKVAEKLLQRNPDIVVDKVLMHQSGLKMMNMWVDKIGLPMSIVKHTLPLYANMTAANIPVSLDYWARKGEIARGDMMLFFAPAAGGHYIAMLWRY